MISEVKLKELQEQRKIIHANKTIRKIAFNYLSIKSELKAKDEETFKEKQQRIKKVAESLELE